MAEEKKKPEEKKPEEKKPEENKEGEHNGEAEPKGKKKKLPMLWIILGLLTVLGSAGGTFLFMFMKGGAEEPKGGKKTKQAHEGQDEHAAEGGEAAEGGGEAHSEEAAAHGEEGGDHGGGEGGGDDGPANCPKHEEGGGGHGAKAPTYTETFAFEPFIVNLAGEAEKNFLKVTVKLKLAKAECTPMVEPHVPEMRDSILLLLSSKNYETIKTVQGKMELRDEILERVQHIVKGNRVKAVFFTDFVAQ